MKQSRPFILSTGGWLYATWWLSEAWTVAATCSNDAANMMTAMVKAKQISEAANQRFKILTLDQQLYGVAITVALHVLWENEAKFHNFYLRLGGMHLLMSYCGSLMADTGIVEILCVAFGGVLKMLSSMTFPQNVRALRMLVEERLRPLFGKNSFHNMDDLLQEWDAIYVKSQTSQLWVDSLIKPIFAILKYIRA